MSIKSQSSADPSQFSTNPMSNRLQSIPIRFQSCTNLMSNQCQSSANLCPICQRSPNPMSTVLLKSNVNPWPISQSDVNSLQIHPNSMPTQCRSQSFAEPMPIHVDVSTSPKFNSNLNPSPISQSHGDLPIPCKSANFFSVRITVYILNYSNDSKYSNCSL